MREESHLDEMRSAIRGDFERLAERRGDQELMRVDARPKTAADPVEALPVEAEVVDTELLDGERFENGLVEPAIEPEPPRRSWLARFLGL